MSEGKREREREQKRERERERERERRESSKNTLESEPCSPSWRHFLACPKAHWPGADQGARRTAPAPRAPSWSSHRASLRPRALPLCPSASPQRCHASARRTPSDELPSDVRERAAVSLGAEPLAEPLEPSAYRAFRLCDECRTQTASVYATSLPLSCSFALRSAGTAQCLVCWA